MSVNEDFDFDQGCPFFIFLSRAFFKITVSFLRLKFSTLFISTNFLMSVVLFKIKVVVIFECQR